MRFPTGWTTRPTLTPEQIATLASKPRTHWTDEQWLALGAPDAALKLKGFSPGVARDEFVNEVLAADGSVHGGDAVIAAMLAAADKHMTPAEFSPFPSARALVQDHLDQKRFVFLVDDRGVPQVYFQCHVDHNPDVPGTTGHKAAQAALAKARKLAVVEHLKAASSAKPAAAKRSRKGGAS